MSLIIITSIGCILLIGVALIAIWTDFSREFLWHLLVTLFSLLMVFLALFFGVRGYILENNLLYIQRLSWNLKIELSNLIDIEIDPKAMDKSIRLWGNGGLFSFVGSFYNRKLGFYRAYATDPHRAVILRFPKSTVIITPTKPEKFVNKVAKCLNFQLKQPNHSLGAD
jgi:hypothetical protein